jgi:hypothetical protein
LCPTPRSFSLLQYMRGKAAHCTRRFGLTSRLALWYGSVWGMTRYYERRIDIKWKLFR